MKSKPNVLQLSACSIRFECINAKGVQLSRNVKQRHFYHISNFTTVFMNMYIFKNAKIFSHFLLKDESFVLSLLPFQDSNYVQVRPFHHVHVCLMFFSCAPILFIFMLQSDVFYEPTFRVTELFFSCVQSAVKTITQS